VSIWISIIINLIVNSKSARHQNVGYGLKSDVFLQPHFTLYLSKIQKMNFLNKTLLLLAITLGVISCSRPEAPEETPVEGVKGKILLIHPTVNNLRIFLYLTENGILPLPAGFHAVGVYHQSETYDYGLSHDFLKGNNISTISLTGLETPLEPESLYGTNVLTEGFRELFNESEGAIFMGGFDIPPSLYGEQVSLLTVISDPHRHYLELSFLFHLLGGSQDESFEPFLTQKPDYRILGICLGMQTMNVATGGTLVQDIPSQIYGLKTMEEVLSLPPDNRHRNYYNSLKTDVRILADFPHRIKTVEGSLMHKITSGNQPVVMSSHHQSLGRMGKGWKVTAHCMDGIIPEAIEHDLYPNVLGIQFHPERLHIFRNEPLVLLPGQEDAPSYADAYRGEAGMDFHRNFWWHIGDMYQKSLPEVPAE
jgi:putative glutamine amidotransferase